MSLIWTRDPAIEVSIYQSGALTTGPPRRNFDIGTELYNSLFLDLIFQQKILTAHQYYYCTLSDHQQKAIDFTVQIDFCNDHPILAYHFLAY